MVKRGYLSRSPFTRERKDAEIRLELIDELLKGYEKPEDITGEGGLLKQLTKAVLERALESEMTHELGYESTRWRGGTGQFAEWQEPEEVADRLRRDGGCHTRDRKENSSLDCEEGNGVSRDSTTRYCRCTVVG